MIQAPGEVRHELSTKIEKVGYEYHVSTNYLSLPVEWIVPRFGSQRQLVVCATCKKQLDVIVFSSFTNTVWTLSFRIPLLAAIVYFGWFLTQLKDAAEIIYWTGMILIFGLGTLVAWGVLSCALLGHRPSARIRRKINSFKYSDHVVAVGAQVDQWKKPWQWIILLIVVSAAGLLGHQYDRVQRGMLVPGDTLIKLLGQNRNSPEVSELISRLGKIEVSKVNQSTEVWHRYRLTIQNQAGKIVSLIYGPNAGLHLGDLPFGLSFADSPEDVNRKLSFAAQNEKIPANASFWRSDKHGLRLEFAYNRLRTIEVLPKETVSD